MSQMHSATARTVVAVSAVAIAACTTANDSGPARDIPEAQYTITDEATHNRFSSAIEPVLRVPSGAVIEAYTKEATDRQLTLASTADDLAGSRSNRSIR